jgi:hypothetical protein
VRHLFYEDDSVKVTDEWQAMRGHRLLRATLIALVDGALSSSPPYDHADGQKLFLKTARVERVQGYIFFRRSPVAENELLILGMGRGQPGRAVRVEMMRRLIASVGM